MFFMLAVLLHGYESLCLTEASVSRLSSCRNMRIREMFRVAMHKA